MRILEIPAENWWAVKEALELDNVEYVILPSLPEFVVIGIPKKGESK